MFTPNQNEDLFHLFNKSTGNYISGFGKKGRGPGEVLAAYNAHLDEYAGVISLYDKSKNSVIKFDLKKFIAGERNYWKSTDMTDIIKTSQESIFIDDGLETKSNIWVKGRGESMRYGILDSNGSIKVVSKDYPRLVKDVEENWAVWSFESKWTFRPEGDKMVVTTYIGALLEIHSIDDNLSMVQDTLIAFTKPIYREAGGTPKWITHTEQTEFGFENITVTDQFIYALRSNPTFTAGDGDKMELYVLDWKGNGVKKYLFDNWLYSIAVDHSDKKLYALVQSEVDAEYILMCYSI